ncbi:MAG: type IV pilus modification protein PilV [Acidiferrobacterales bacterium]|nr:type IV pilus modification protein PilV [Acidiferrobacterales bacterium]
MNFYTSNPKKSQRGVGLIEILISLAVISIGMIGLVGLQFSVSTSNQDAYVKSQATLIIESLSDRIRINRQYQNRDDTTTPAVDATDNAYTTLNNYNFRNLDACDGSEFDCFCEQTPPAIVNCRDEGAVNAALCTPQDAAVFDAYETSCMAASIMNDMEVGVVALNPQPGAAGDAVGPNSILTVYTAWPATIWKNLDRAANEMCNDILDAQGINGDYECVYMDLVIGDGS